MVRRRRAHAIAALAAGLMLLCAAPASAHTLARGPYTGSLGTRIRVSGSGWQPGGTVVGAYYSDPAGRTPQSTWTVRASAQGRLRASWTQVANPGAHKLCFTQRDTRLGRTFRTCTPIWVYQPTASVLPSGTTAGGSVLLYAEGFLPGRAVTFTVSDGGGGTQTFTARARSGGGWVQTRSRGPVWVSRGSAVFDLATGAGLPDGVYTVLATQPGLAAFTGFLLG